MGKSGVALFFMITAFLFFSKILDSKDAEIDWGKLFASRVKRIAPLYLVSIIILFSIVWFMSNGILVDSPAKIGLDAAKWLSFSQFGMPDLNGVKDTYLIIAGVSWSLPYEWGFYFLLPLLALSAGKRPSPPYLLFSAGALLTIAALVAAGKTPLFPYAFFIGGMAAALLARQARFRAFATGKLASCVIILSIVGVVTLYRFPDRPLAILALSLAFSLIAAGNTLFGALVSGSARMLGEMAYGIYLLHGIVLFCTFHFVLGLPLARQLDGLGYWLVICGITPLLVLTAYAAFRWIEHPAMRYRFGARRASRLWGIGRLFSWTDRTVR
ncbi:acyltransferase family protein [Rugamonas sp. DEMB1]|uniref:acyltransferase family protein n=1 Tax=Rugamonas sp. DEMB1 TaxID=3039386 RepID=UPI002448D3EB|nr:acyltransferase [Rugamonas sp. DEMB1]WGG49127.1 acyltransferase [Rugamonas sp. DEMB1]